METERNLLPTTEAAKYLGLREFDKIEMADDDGKVYSHKTNFA